MNASPYASENKFQLDRFAYGLFLWVFPLVVMLTPLHLGGVPVWSFSIPVFLLAAFFSFYWFTALAAGNLPVIPTALDRWIVAYLIFFTLSSFQTKIFYSTLVEWYRLGFILLSFIATLYYCREEKRIGRLCMILSFLGAALSLLGLLQLVGGLPHAWWHKPFFLSSVYVNHNHFAGLLEMLLPLSLGLVYSEKDKAKKAALLYMTGLMGVAFLLSLSRGGFISITGGLLFMLLLLIKRGAFNRAWWIFIVLGLLITCALLVFGVEPLVERLETLKRLGQAGEGTESRPHIWQGSVHLISKNLFFGTGPGTFALSFLPYRPDGFTGRPGHAHNDYLNLLADCGLFAFLAVLGLFAMLIWKGLELTRQDPKRWQVGVGCGILAALFSLGIHSIIDFNFHIPANFMIFAVLSGILLSLDRPTAPSLAIKKSIRTYLVSAGLVVLLVMSLFLGVSHFFHWKAGKSLSKGNYPAAIGYLDRAIFLNRINPSGYFLKGLALMREAKAGGDKDKSLYKKAILNLEKATQLNPLEPYYDYNRAKAYRKLYDINKLYDIIRYYEQSVKKDTKDPRLHFLVGKDLLTLSQTTKDPVVEQKAKIILAHTMDLDWDYTVPVYRLLWRHRADIRDLENFAKMTKTNLEGLLQFFEKADIWAYHRRFFLRSLNLPDFSSRSTVTVNPDKWQRLNIEAFESVSGKKVHAGTLFYRNGEIAHSVETVGDSRLVLKARSRQVGQSYGYLVIKLDGKVINSLYIGSASPMEYITFLKEKPGVHTIGIRYLNNRGGDKKSEDRNVLIEEAWLG